MRARWTEKYRYVPEERDPSPFSSSVLLARKDDGGSLAKRTDSEEHESESNQGPADWLPEVTVPCRVFDRGNGLGDLEPLCLENGLQGGKLRVCRDYGS